MRLILLAFFLLLLALGALIILVILRAIGGPAPQPQHLEGGMPKSVKTIAYVALLILMFGVTSGILGAS